jgi:chlorite dismutase
MNSTTQFIGSHSGLWKVIQLNRVKGESIAKPEYIDITNDGDAPQSNALWSLKGFNSNIRYTHKDEKQLLQAKQAPLARPEATCAALIPIKKSDAWWELAQDERRAIFDSSKHIGIGLDYLPQIARKLYHCRDLNEPFDFLTWFEYAPENAALFERLVEQLRHTEEWEYVDREIDIRLVR